MQLAVLRSFSRLKQSSGNTLMEYAVIGGAVLCVCIGVFYVVGDNLKLIFTDLRQDMKQQVASTQEQSAAGNAVLPDAGESGNQFPNAKICYTGNWCLNAKAIQSQSTIQAAGANGALETVKEQASLIKELAEQAAEHPETDPQFVDVITDLANAGHKIADNLDSAVADYVRKDGAYYNSYDSFWRSQMPFDRLRDNAFDYLSTNPKTLPPEMQRILKGATGAINGKLSLLIDDYGPTYENWEIMLKTSNRGSSAFHSDSNSTCENGGDTSQCMRLNERDDDKNGSERP